jgi:hypothetical protein
VVIDDFYIMGIAVGPGEADPPLVVDANAVLTLTIATVTLALSSASSDC